MENLRDKMFMEYKHYSRLEKTRLIERSIKALGKDVHLVICLEEIAKLIEVIIKNTDNTMDIDAYLHTAEEIADLEIASDMLRVIANIQLDEDYEIPSKMERDDFISYLVMAQQKISKYMRYNEYEYAKEAYRCIDNVLYRIYVFYNIRSNDVDKIIDIKLDRFKKRTIEAEEANKNQEEVK